MGKSDLAEFISWIDLSDEDQKRARDYLSSLSEGTLDELGLGVIRDTFADTFFPATSTVMTRARYFIFVPSIYISVIKAELTGSKARKACDELEHQLRTSLRDKGLLKSRKDKVQRYPASIYWSGLRRLKILQQPGSQARYFNQLESQLNNQVLIEDDDKNVHLEHEAGPLWHPELVELYDAAKIPRPSLGSGFNEGDVDFAISPVEAKYLKSRFLENEADTVIANAFRKDHFEPAAYPWIWDYPTSLKREIGHAKCFSMICKLATLMYYLMLDQRRVKIGKPGIDRDITETIDHWFSCTRNELLQWVVSDFIEWAKEKDCLRRNDTKFFTELFRHFCSAKSPSALWKSNKVHELIVERERAKRPSKRRLVPGRFQNEWKMPNLPESYYSDPYHVQFELNFRSGIASQIVTDIFEGPQHVK